MKTYIGKAFAGVVLLSLLVLALPVSQASAQKFPEKIIRIYVGFPAGTGPDLIAHFLAQKLTDLAGKPVIVENRVGASGNIAVETAARSNPDGYSLVLSTSGSASYHTRLFKHLGYDPLVDLAPVSGVLSSSYVLLVSASSGVNTVEEFVKRLRGQDKVTFGSNGSASLLAGELFRNAAKVDAVQVMYRDNGGLLNDLLGGNIDYGFLDSTAAFGLIKEGRVKGLAVSATKRMAVAPQYPTFVELGMPDVVLTGWLAIFAPAKTPPEILNTLNGWFRTVLKADDTRKLIENGGADVMSGDPEELRNTQKVDTAKWGEYVRLLKLEPQ